MAWFLTLFPFYQYIGTGEHYTFLIISEIYSIRDTTRAVFKGVCILGPVNSYPREIIFHQLSWKIPLQDMIYSPCLPTF